MSKFKLLVLILSLAVLVSAVACSSVAPLDTKTLQGRVTAADGTPVPRADVTVGAQSALTDAQGAFALAVPHGNWQVQVRADGFEPTEQPVDASDWLARNLTMQFTLKPIVWRGQVVDAATRTSLAGVQVKIGGRTLQSDAQGEFTALGVRNGAKIELTHPGYRALTLSVQAVGSSAQTTVLSLAPNELRVTVIDGTTKKPLPGVRVSAGGQHANTDIQGLAVLKGLEQGAVVLARAPGYANVSQTVGAEQWVTLELQPTILDGQVVDAATQAPIADALLLYANADGAVTSAAQANAKGSFTIQDFTTVPKLYVKKPGYRVGTFELNRGGAQDLTLTPFKAKGIHLYYGISREDTERVLNALQGTAMNAVVFDVKEDPGYLLWDSQAPLAKQIGAYKERSYTAQAQVETCRQYQLYCIARVTVFKDNLLAQERPDLALHNASGGLLYENAAYWTNPASQEVQDYHIALAQELAAMGFDEIQFDYIRYPGTRDVLAREFGDATFRVAHIADLLERAQAGLRNTPAFFSGDVFGLTTATDDEQGIGQVWEEIAPYFDYISPMMYPSTWRYATNLWGTGFGITNCADAYACPYDIIHSGTRKARERTAGDWTLIRPWIQAYGMNLGEMLAQSRGADDADSAGYLFWNNQGIYPDGLFSQ